MDITQLSFTVPEILSLIGLTQCIYILVYIIFRAGDWSRALLPIVYFAVLGSAFFMDFAASTFAEHSPYYAIRQWAAWFMGPPLAVLLLIQIAQISRVPSLRNFWVLFLVPIAFVLSLLMAQQDADCSLPDDCKILSEWLVIFGLVAGALAMGSIFFHADKLKALHVQKEGRARYWLILMLVVTNLLLLLVMLLSLTTTLISSDDAVIARTILGLGFVYLAGTSLFRIYPQALQITPHPRMSANTLGAQDKELAIQIEKLMDLDKVYQEPSYSRADLARELDVPETTISRIINAHFGKSFPQLLSERRVADAKRLLAETKAPVKLVAEQAGFNSTASFNRVFRELTGKTPSEFRGRGE